MPDGGLSFWLRFTNSKALDRIESRAAGLGVWVAPSKSFMARRDAPRGLRLGFASLTEQEARDGIRAVAHSVVGLRRAGTADPTFLIGPHGE